MNWFSSAPFAGRLGLSTFADEQPSAQAGRDRQSGKGLEVCRIGPDKSLAACVRRSAAPNGGLLPVNAVGRSLAIMPLIRPGS
jgi:hypothetical protein